MTIRIINPQDWACVKPGEWLELPGEGGRLVKMELNAEAPTRVDYVEVVGDKVVNRYFLGVIQGLEKIEFRAAAASALDFTSEGEVWYFTTDGQATAAEMPDEASFTKLLQRKSRSDQLEHMMRLQQANFERVMEQQRQEREALEAELEAMRNADDTGTASAASGIGEPAPEGAEQPSGEGENPPAAGGGDGVPA